MYLLVEILDARDSESQLIKFKNIGIIGFMLTKLNKQYKFTGIENNPDCNTGMFLMNVGYGEIPLKEILQHDSFEIKKVWQYTKNVANEMYFNRYILKI